MVFLAALTVLLYANAFACWRMSARDKRAIPVLGLHMIAMTSGGAAFVFGQIEKYRQVVPNHNISAPLFCLAGLCTFAAFARKAVQIVRSGDETAAGAGGWRIGVSTVVLCIGLYMMSTVADHYWYFRSEESGIVNVDFLQLKDPPCSGYALLRFDGDLAVYRCPGILSFGSAINEPFVPWPGYVEGSSRDMKSALDRALSDTQSNKTIK